MCRLAYFPPGFKRNDALDILLEEEKANSDGVGEVFVRDGKFVVNKYPFSLTKAVRDKVPLLHHMPFNGGTVVHLRAKTHGEKIYRNTHPFITNSGRWAICHNGLFSEHKVIRLALQKFIQINSECDSAVAAELIDLITPKKFSEEMSFSGTFLCLNLDGHVEVMKTSFSADLAAHVFNDDSFLISSELPKDDYKQIEMKEGWFKLSPQGKLISFKKKVDKWFNSDYSIKETPSIVLPNGDIEYYKNKSALERIGDFHKTYTNYYTGYEG